MTGKELLRERIEELTEEEAADWLCIFEEARLSEPASLTEAEILHIRQGLDDLESGRKVLHEEVMRRFGSHR